ncbi:hypothetical protein H9Q13_08835 [Pontibacter sp. JH31]|uniref:Uncharacterized protein n=1 Tax=Pontibacter aquaedesilientis TaxID=2766980 RepID=A0ABR7XG51_9BACT|nr:hypothetical protein [Pontibacter aquaedesilientis]MBD1397267.1 hypothetical protein [Pontibacter aquaedesilientis]
MKKDIDFTPVEGVAVAIAATGDIPEERTWNVYLINNNNVPLDNVFVTSKGYGIIKDEEVKTSVLRHMFERVEPKSYVQVEVIDPSVFKLNNEYWVSYYIDGKIYDKRFVFVPDSITEDHLIEISMLQMQGVLHS